MIETREDGTADFADGADLWEGERRVRQSRKEVFLTLISLGTLIETGESEAPNPKSETRLEA
jgi:hypothetical protein